MAGFRNNFTLIELVIVITIILLLAGLAAGRLGMTPVFATRERALRELESFFAKGGRIAATQGKTAEIRYLPEEHAFRLEVDETAANPVDSMRFLPLPKAVNVDFPDFPDRPDEARIRCFPDGSSAGPRLRLTVGGESVTLKFSSLSGQLRREPEIP